jgi:hypothetical protein
MRCDRPSVSLDCGLLRWGDRASGLRYDGGAWISCSAYAR